MARLVRMDQTGHTTLAEWTPGDAAAVEAAALAFREELDRGLLRGRQHGRGARRAGARAARGRRARDPAAADRRRLMHRPGPARDRGRLLAAAARRRAAAPARARLDAEHARAHDPVPRRRGADARARAALVPGRGDRDRPRLGDPGALRQSRRLRGPARARAPTTGPERTALGLLGDLLGHEARDAARPHRPRAGARRAGRLARGGGRRAARPAGRPARRLLVREGRRRLASADRTAHLLLALREDEAGFATVANLAFSGGTWRLRHRLPQPMRPALAAARATA